MRVYRKIRRLQPGKQLNARSHLISHHLIDNFMCECSFNVDELKSSNVGIVIAIVFHVNQSRVLR